MTSPNKSNSSELSFSDPRIAQRTRDAIRQIAGSVVDLKGSNPNIGRVMSVDIARLTASVWFPGDDAPVQVGLFPGSIPLDLGDFRATNTFNSSTVGTGGLVYVENFRGSPYITRILSGGEYQLNANVAGVTHRMFNANPQNTIQGPPVVSDIYQREINVRVETGSDFTVGKALLVGPWSGRNDGSSVDGIVELVLSFYVEGDVKNQVRKYQFSISDRMVVDLEGDEGNKAFWMRVLPETNLGTVPHAELAVDVALVKTGIRTALEFWIRLVPLDSLADQSVYFMSVKTYGSAFNVGDPRTGRLVTIMQSVAEPVQGWIGFNNAGHAWTERDEYPAFPIGSYYQGDEWSSGSWRSSALRAANDMRPLWRATGQWTWTTTSRLRWEGNIVFTGLGPNYNILHSGQVSVPYPDVSNVPVFPSDTANFPTQFRTTSNGIELRAGETLYWGMMPGLGAGGQSSWINPKDLFFIVDSKTYNASQKPYALPEWAIPIASRAWTVNGERRDIIICNPQVQEDLDDRTAYQISTYPTSHSGILQGDDTETMEVLGFRYQAKTAYRISFRTGVGATVPGGAQVTIWRATSAGASTGVPYGEMFRYPMVLTGTGFPHFAQGSIIVVNDTTADIVQHITLSIKYTPTGTGTGATLTRWGTAVTPAYLMVERIGNAGKYFAIGEQV